MGQSSSRSTPPGFGETLPFFTAETDGVPNYSIDVAAGRWIVLMSFGSLASPGVIAAHDAVLARSALFNDRDAAFFGVSADPKDRFERGLSNAAVGRRYFWDFDRRVATLFPPSPTVYLVDRGFRVVMAEPVERTPAVLDRLAEELAAELGLDPAPHAPVLVLPRVFEADFCQTLIDYFNAHTPEVSGFAATADGRTVNVVNPRFKRRQDVTIDDDALIAEIRSKFERRLFPAIQRAYQWRAAHVERFLLCRYDAEDQGFFAAHRDDATKGTAHRQFAVTINLNSGDYEGGALRFPEFGDRPYAPPTGGAAAFSCSLLHEVIPVTRGERYCFVPFLFDEDGERIRRRNLAAVGANGGSRRDRRAEQARSRSSR